MMPESAYVLSLLHSDVESLRSCYSRIVDDFYKRYDPFKSLDKSFILEVLASVHVVLDYLMNELREMGVKYEDKSNVKQKNK